MSQSVSPEQLSAYAAWAAAGVALLSVIAGPLISRWQIRVNAATQQALDQISLMTDDLAAFVGACQRVATHPNLHQSDVLEWKRQMDDIAFYKAKVTLRLDPTRDIDKELNDTAKNLQNVIALERDNPEMGQKALKYINQFPVLLHKWKAQVWKRTIPRPLTSILSRRS